MADEPIRTQQAQIIKGGLNVQMGTLLLYQDRLSHVVGNALSNPAVGGALGMVVGGKLAKNKAGAKEAAGGKGVTTIPLAQITEVRKGTKALQRNLLEVVASDGTSVKFGVKFDKWKDDLIAALTNAGHQVNDAGDVVSVS